MKYTVSTVFACLLAICVVLPSHAEGPSMRLGGRTSQPVGHFDFCKRLPSECAFHRSKADLTLTTRLRRVLLSINTKVNSMVLPMSDIEHNGKDEVWAYPKKYGDCEDYVLLKRKMLMSAGIPQGNLLITVVRQLNDEAHAILTVVTDHGDLILDNLTNNIYVWNKTGYRFIKRQSEYHAGQWVAIREVDPTPVASIELPRSGRIPLERPAYP